MFSPKSKLPTVPKLSMYRVKRRHDRKQHGVTILEWLTAMSILLIATTAIIGMQSTTLQAHKVSDDVIVANNLALQASEFLQTDALRWRQNLSQTLYFTANPATVGSPNWRAITFSPVNFQWSSSADQGSITWNTTAASLEERTYSRANYCVFYTYRWAGSDSPNVTRQGYTVGRPAGQDEMLEVTISVTWPYTSRGLSSALRNFHNTCGSTSGSFDSNLIQSIIASGPTLISSGARTYLRQVRHTFYIRRDLAGGM